MRTSFKDDDRPSSDRYASRGPGGTDAEQVTRCTADPARLVRHGQTLNIMDTKDPSQRSNEENTRDERYATGLTGSSASDPQRNPQGGYREWTDRWDETRTKLQRNYSQLTDSDLRLEAGKEEELVTRLSQKLGRTPEDTRKLLQDTSSATRNQGPTAERDTSTGERDKDRPR